MSAACSAPDWAAALASSAVAERKASDKLCKQKAVQETSPSVQVSMPDEWQLLQETFTNFCCGFYYGRAGDPGHE